MSEPGLHPGTSVPPGPATLGSLLTLAWPLIVSRLSQVVVSLADGVMVAHLGASALAATTTGASNAFTLMIFGLGIVYIVSSFTSQLFGRGERVAARRYAWYGLGVALGVQALCVLSIPAWPRVLAWLPYEPEVERLMLDYLTWRLLSGGAVVGIEALANYFGGLGRTRPGMVANLAAMGLNVALNWVLIDGHLGAPALGVVGAALASSLATWAALLGLLAYFLWEGRAFPRPALAGRELGRVLRFGLPNGVNWLFEFLAFAFFVNVVVAGLGTPELAAINAVFLLNSVAFMPAFGLASAGAILVGQAIGAGRKDAVPGLVWLTVRVAGAWQGLAGLAYLLVPGALMLPFARGADAAQVTAVGVRMLLVSAAWQLFDATATTLAEALRAAGDTLFPLVARLVIAWTVFVPGALATVYFWGGREVGATLWLVAYLALLAGALYLRFRTGAWRRVELVEPEVPAP
ncbi:MAG TPA: MATE family efflux transporter [Myxococcota bacterium]|nr:MATE family efflux transporter [Myxococcota bacterium]HRY94151.1 MATE family efflux transporter [Myxococcota bacterium]HSA21884.1 MATE family efflux transporter [Myxococcota bacterium]